MEQEERRVAERYVIIRELATHMRRDKSTVVAAAMRLGIKPVKIRHGGTGQLSLAVTDAEARQIIGADRPAFEIIKPEDL